MNALLLTKSREGRSKNGKKHVLRTASMASSWHKKKHESYWQNHILGPISFAITSMVTSMLPPTTGPRVGVEAGHGASLVPSLHQVPGGIFAVDVSPWRRRGLSSWCNLTMKHDEKSSA